MPKPNLFAAIDNLADKIIARLPAKLQQTLATWSRQQRQTAFIASFGVIIFLFLWLIFNALFGTNIAELDRSAFGPKPTASEGTKTAIVKPLKSFPETEIPAVTPIENNAPKAISNLTPAQQEQIIRLRNNVDHQYKNVLSFDLDESKMISFAQAAAKIDHINMKWDTLIAGAPDESRAIEYLSNTELEIKTLLNTSIGVTIKEYNEIYGLSARDDKFNEIANAYKNLVAQGVWGPVTPAIIRSPSKVDPKLRFPVSPPKPATNPAAPAASGIAPAPVGSPALPYSPPPAR
jgi:hypothetical protein